MACDRHPEPQAQDKFGGIVCYSPLNTRNSLVLTNASFKPSLRNPLKLSTGHNTRSPAPPLLLNGHILVDRQEVYCSCPFASPFCE